MDRQMLAQVNIPVEEEIKGKFIVDNGKVRNCDSNNAKMNIFEWMWYRRERLLTVLLESLKQLKEGFILIFAGIINLLSVILFPITFPIVAYHNIKLAKEEVAKHEKYSKPLADRFNERKL